MGDFFSCKIIIIFSDIKNFMMKKTMFKKIITSIALFSAIFIFSQSRTEDFLLSMPEKKVSNSLYKSIKLIDARIDTTSMGIVQKGAFNVKARVVPSIPLRKQFQDLITSLNTSNAQGGELVIYLKQFSFAEITGMVSEKGYCYIQAYLFSKNADGKYQPLNKIDSVIVHSSMDVTKATMRKGSELLANFVIEKMNRKNNSTENYSIEEIMNFDRIQRLKYNLFRQENLVNGIYNTFQDFRDQKPSNIEVSSIKKIGDDKVIKIYSMQNGKEKVVDKENFYALIHEGIPYIYSDLDRNFIKLTKKNDGDFYFIGRAKTNAKTGDVLVASVFFGIIGGLIASDASANFEMKLDYMNGGFIPIKEVIKK